MNKLPNRVADIVRFGLCTGCGLCESLGGERLPMRLNAEGHLRPDVPADLGPGLESTILAACPGLHQRGIKTREANVLWGPYKRMLLGHAGDPSLRYTASSSGVVTATAGYLLERGTADAVLHLAADIAHPTRNCAQISRTHDELLARVGARYGPGAPLQLLHPLIDTGERIVVIGKPCDIAAIRNLAVQDARIDDQVVATISFFCAGLPGHGVTRSIMGKYGLAETDVRVLRYRGHGCPGLTHIEARDGRVFEQTYHETWADDLNQGVQFRCKICPDSTGEQADIVCADAWEGAEGYPLTDDGDGYNVVIARTVKGRTLLDRMLCDGVISADPIAAHRLNVMHPNHVRRKSQVLSRLAGLAVTKQPRPRYQNLRLRRAALCGMRDALSNFRGMIRRIRQGNNREHLPSCREACDYGMRVGWHQKVTVGSKSQRSHSD